MKNRNLFLTVLLSAFIFLLNNPQMLLAADSLTVICLLPEDAVKITDRGNYYEVTMDYTRGINHYCMGVELGRKIVQIRPDYEKLLDSYVEEITGSPLSFYDFFLSRVYDIRPQMDQEYQDEIDGMASQFSGGNVNRAGDNKVSRDELYLIQLLSEVYRGTQCSGISVYGERSETGNPMTARILDWYGGEKNQLGQLQAVTRILYSDKSTCLINGRKSICLIGYLGHLTTITGFNCDGVFAGILDSGTGATYSSTDKYSYTTDLRYALENSATLNDVANYVTNPSRNYTFNHNVLLSDSQTSKVLENNFSGTGTNMERALRSDTSALNPGITWGFTDAVATVNSFLLLGNHDNHTGNPSNMKRWESIKNQLLNYGETITLDELKLIASFDNNDGPDSKTTGDIYNENTQQIVLFQPDNFEFEVAFKPKSDILPADPVFEKLSKWNNTHAYGHTLKMDKKAPAAVKDIITFNAIVENPYAHQISAMLIFENLKGGIVDSVEMFPVDLAANDSWQCEWITENFPEDMYWLSVKVTDNTSGTYFTNKHLSRITNIPLVLDSISWSESSANKYRIQPFFRNSGISKKLSSLKINITNNDSWITSIAPGELNINHVDPGETVQRIAFNVLSDAGSFPGYFNLNFSVSTDNWPYWSFDTTIYIVATGIEQVGTPNIFELEQNYPNPFSSATTISWLLNENSKVTLKVLDIVGRTVEILVDEQRPSGKYETQFNAATLPKGIYFYQLKAGKNVQTRKMILLE